MRVVAVAQNTLRESVRDRVLYVLLFFAAATILGSKAVGRISIGQDIKIVKDFSLASLSLFGVLVAIFVGTNLVYKEIDKKTLYTILARPMHRWEFVLGKFCGLLALLALVTLGMACVSVAYVYILGGTVTVTYGYAVILIFAKLAVVTALALTLSTVTAPVVGAIMAFCLYLLGHATGIFLDLPPQLKGSFTETLFRVLYYVIPNLSNFDIRAEAANDVPVAFGYVFWALGYGLGWTCFFLILAVLAFEDKDV